MISTIKRIRVFFDFDLLVVVDPNPLTPQLCWGCRAGELRLGGQSGELSVAVRALYIHLSGVATPDADATRTLGTGAPRAVTRPMHGRLGRLRRFRRRRGRGWRSRDSRLRSGLGGDQPELLVAPPTLDHVPGLLVEYIVLVSTPRMRTERPGIRQDDCGRQISRRRRRLNRLRNRRHLTNDLVILVTARTPNHVSGLELARIHAVVAVGTLHVLIHRTHDRLLVLLGRKP